MSMLGTRSSLPASGSASGSGPVAVRSHGSRSGTKWPETEPSSLECTEQCPMHCPQKTVQTTQPENWPNYPDESGEDTFDVENPSPGFVEKQRALFDDVAVSMCTPDRPAGPILPGPSRQPEPMEVSFTPSPAPKPRPMPAPSVPKPRPVDAQEVPIRPEAVPRDREKAELLARMAQLEEKLTTQGELFALMMQEAVCPCKDPNTCPCKEHCEAEWAENCWDDPSPPAPPAPEEPQERFVDTEGNSVHKDKQVQPKPRPEQQPRPSRRERDIAEATWVTSNRESPQRTRSKERSGGPVREKTKRTGSKGPYPVHQPQYETDDEDEPVCIGIGDDFSAPERFKQYASSGSVLGSRTPKNKYTGTPMGHDLSGLQFSVPDLVNAGPSYQVNAFGVSNSGSQTLPFMSGMPQFGLLNPIALAMAQRQATVPSWDGKTSTWLSFRKAWMAYLPALQPSTPIMLLYSFLSCLPASESKRWTDTLQDDAGLTWEVVCDTLDKECLKDTSEFRHGELLSLPNCENSFDALRSWKATFLRHVSRQDDMSTREAYRLLLSKLHPDMAKKVGEHEVRLSRRLYPIRISGAAIPSKFLLAECANLQKSGKIRHTISRIKVYTNSVEFCCGSLADRETWVLQLQGLETKWGSSPLEVSPTHLRLTIAEAFEHLFASYREQEHLADRTAPPPKPDESAEVARIESDNVPQPSSKGGGKGKGKGAGKGKGNGVCYLCKKEGHFAAQCPGQPQCYNCKQFGHLATNCPQKQGNSGVRAPPGAGTTKVCYTCKLSDKPFDHNHLECALWQRVQRARLMRQKKQEEEAMKMSQPPAGPPPQNP
jgi:hypothetical protein